MDVRLVPGFDGWREFAVLRRLDVFGQAKQGGTNLARPGANSTENLALPNTAICPYPGLMRRWPGKSQVSRNTAVTRVTTEKMWATR